MEFKGCTISSNEDVISALVNHDRLVQVVKDDISEAKSKFLKDNQGYTESIWYLFKNEVTAKEILREDIDWCFGKYISVLDKLEKLDYLSSEYNKVLDSRFDDVLRWEVTYNDLRDLSSIEGDNYVTPIQAAFISEFKNRD